MNYYLGIDAGGTKTRAALVSADGDVLGTGEAGPANYHNVGLDIATANMCAAAVAAWAAHGRPFQPATSAFLGCAGVKAAIDIAQLTSSAEDAGLAAVGAITVANDLHNALTGGLAGRPGIALIAGTGSNCLGRDGSGATFMCGGWGWLLDDEGAAAGLAIAAMRYVARAADRRLPATRLLPALLAFLGLSEPDELLARLYVQPWTPEQLARFAPEVVRIAAEGDAAAGTLLAAGASALAALVAVTARQLTFLDGPEVVILGGCARSGPPYQPLIESAIRAAVPSAKLVEPALSTTHGAALNALRAAGINPLPVLRF